MDEERFRAKLNPEQYRIMREKGTEMPYISKHWDHYESGVYFCAACGARIFSSLAKFNAGEGWPTFRNPTSEKAVEVKTDGEVVCRKCRSHLGEIAGEGEHKYYRVNSACLDFQAVGIEFEEEENEDNKGEADEAKREAGGGDKKKKTGERKFTLTASFPVLGGLAAGLVAGVGIGTFWCQSAQLNYERKDTPISPPALDQPTSAGESIPESVSGATLPAPAGSTTGEAPKEEVVLQNAAILPPSDSGTAPPKSGTTTEASATVASPDTATGVVRPENTTGEGAGSAPIAP